MTAGCTSHHRHHGAIITLWLRVLWCCRPVYSGDPAAIGIDDIGTPHYGDAVTIHPGEVPVFWACGVTPQAALLQAKVPIAITHAPGHMFVTDKTNAELAGFSELDVSKYTAAGKAAASSSSSSSTSSGGGKAAAGAGRKGKSA